MNMDSDHGGSGLTVAGLGTTGAMLLGALGLIYSYALWDSGAGVVVLEAVIALSLLAYGLFER